MSQQFEWQYNGSPGPGLNSTTIDPNPFYLPGPASHGHPASISGTRLQSPHTPNTSQPKDVKAKRKVRGGRGSKSGALNRRDAGGSDDEISLLTPSQVQDASLKLEETKPNARGLTDEDKEKMIVYITQPEVFKGYRVNLNNIAIHVSVSVL
jgi:hypothetical protein